MYEERTGGLEVNIATLTKRVRELWGIREECQCQIFLNKKSCTQCL